MPEAVNPEADVLIDASGRRFVLAEGMTIGRADDAVVQLVDAAVSRRHAVVHRSADRWSLTDVGSRNGTRVNDAQLPAFTDHLLRDGDRITIGGVSLRARINEGTDVDATVGLRLPEVATALSPYQRQVTAALAEPWLRGGEPATNAEIAQALGTPDAVEAVKAALRRCYAKAGIADLPTHVKRRELCRHALERGWV